jgi:hypothetical protein
MKHARSLNMSLPYNIKNEEYRDMVAKSIYPFTDSATLTNGVLAIPPRAFLDILIYPTGDFTAPYYLSAIDGIQGDDGEALLTFSDYTGLTVGIAYININADNCYIKQGGSIQIGVIVYDKAAVTKMLGELGVSRTVFTAAQTTIAAGQCFSVRSDNIVAISNKDEAWTGDIKLKADNGVHFGRIPDTGNDAIAIHLYGEAAVKPGSLLTINNTVFPERHVWLAAHTDSKLRVITKAGTIKMMTEGDITYGD